MKMAMRILSNLIGGKDHARVSYRFYMRHHYAAVLGTGSIHGFGFMVIDRGILCI